ncbi:hypothetical protein EKE94_18160 [Mesobaculum littorinae]|uniref:Uncharacterized protein n=1 Tax=Mesobaculum littorinae TaxID=2486419 RepID=A0A438AD18_9RHOB|nr:hypothetical protein [Mesobaculum littorinae]RVV96567.1 hypothetical protein EKE94_18160 [Mesobaculum littorinae]
MARGLQIAEPPRRRGAAAQEKQATGTPQGSSGPAAGTEVEAEAEKGQGGTTGETARKGAPATRTPGSDPEPRTAPKSAPKTAGPRAVAAPSRGEKFSQVAEHDKVQFNKRVTRGTADGYEMLAIRTRRKVPELLAEALELLEERYGRV